MAVECLSLGKRLSWSLHCVDASQAQAKGEHPANLRRGDLYLFGIFTNPHGQGHKYKDRSRSWNDHESDHPHKGSGTYEAPGSSGSEHPLLSPKCEHCRKCSCMYLGHFQKLLLVRVHYKVHEIENSVTFRGEQHLRLTL